MKAFNKLVEYFGQVKERWKFYEKNNLFINSFAAICTENMPCFNRRPIEKTVLRSSELLIEFFNGATLKEQEEIRTLFNKNFLWLIEAPAFRAPAEIDVEISALKLVKNSSLAVTPLHLLIMIATEYSGVSRNMVDFVFDLTTNTEALKVPLNKNIEKEIFPKFNLLKAQSSPINLMLYFLPEIRSDKTLSNHIYMIEKLLDRLESVDLKTKSISDIMLSKSFKYYDFDREGLKNKINSLYEKGNLSEQLLTCNKEHPDLMAEQDEIFENKRKIKSL